MNSDLLRKYLFIENSNKVGKKYYHNDIENYQLKYYNPLDEYRINYIISTSGFFSKVYDITKIDSNDNYVLKMSEPGDLTPVTEIKILSMIKSNYIVKLVDCYYFNEKYYLILEKGRGGNLYNFLQSNLLNETQCKLITKQILLGIMELHNRNIIIKDLKAENILLKDNNIDNNIDNGILISDFNLSIIVNNKDKYTNDRGGTLQYVSPEVLTFHNYYSFKTDIWSLGVLIYYLLIGDLPFNDVNDELIMKNIRDVNYHKPDKWENLTIEAKDLIENILILDVHKRYSLKNIWYHKWLNG